MKMIDISGLVKVKPIHPGHHEFLMGNLWASLIGWLLSAIVTFFICLLFVWLTWEGTADGFREIALVVMQVVLPIVFGLGWLCELMNFFEHRKRLALYYTSLSEDLEEKRMVHNG
jgi:TRAP-type C4-dicarboxylate transport system permease small subunit